MRSTPCSGGPCWTKHRHRKVKSGVARALWRKSNSARYGASRTRGRALPGCCASASSPRSRCCGSVPLSAAVVGRFVPVAALAEVPTGEPLVGDGALPDVRADERRAPLGVRRHPCLRRTPAPPEADREGFPFGAATALSGALLADVGLGGFHFAEQRRRPAMSSRSSWAIRHAVS